MPDPTNLILQGAALASLLAASAFFSMSETALVSADRLALLERVERGDRRALRLEKLLADPERTLTTILVGNNLVNIGATALATLMAVELFASAGAAIATGVMTFLVLVFSEITPKTFAVRHSLGISLLVARPLQAIQTALTPFGWFFTGVAGLLLRMVGVRAKVQPTLVTQAQIEMMVRRGAKEGEVEQFEEKVISEVFDFTETDVQKVITPAARVRFLQKSAHLKDAVELAGKTGHSRLPVVDGDFNHVLGFVHAKDLLRYTDDELDRLPVTHSLRACLFASFDTPSDRLLVRMQRERKLLSVIQDKEGHNLGIATVEDLLEELVGEIHDEFDPVAHKGVPRAPKAPDVTSDAPPSSGH